MYPFYNPSALNAPVLDKGQQILDSLLLNQYENSPNLKAYFAAYFAEMDFLFETLNSVYSGRFIEFAVGAQLDVIGIILQQDRNVELPTVYFGFQGAVPVNGMSDEATPAEGGIFRSEESVGFTVTPLDDATYRRLLLARAYITNQDTCSIDVAYYAFTIALGKVLSTFTLADIGHRQVQLTLAIGSSTLADVQFLLYIAGFLIPAGITFTIIRV
tara:strand:+ start:42 stop:686 length:645 start_codon:yes stop_codon:yes gene_type:complete